MRTWWLSPCRYVKYLEEYVTYCTLHNGNRYCVTLNRTQFLNFDDYIHRRGPLPFMLPLSRGAWFLQNKRLQFDSSPSYFKFDEGTLKTYKRHVHSKIKSFLQHEPYAAGRKHDARHGSRRKSRSDTSSRHNSQQQILPRSSTHVESENGERQELTTVPMRKDTSVGADFSFRRQLNVLESGRNNTDYLSSHPYHTTDIEKYGSICSIENECDSTSH